MTPHGFEEALTRARLSEGDLLMLAAHESRPGLLQIDDRPETAKQQAGRRWLETHREQLRTALCKPELAFLRPEPASERERALMICAIYDCISGVVTGVSPFTAAALVVWRGLDKLCSDG